MLQIEKSDDIAVVRFDDLTKLNALVAEDVKSQLTQEFEAPNTRMIISLDGVRFVDSTGFGAFLSVMKAANNNHGELKICEISDSVMELFKLLQLHNVFEIYNSVADAKKSFN